MKTRVHDPGATFSTAFAPTGAGESKSYIDIGEINANTDLTGGAPGS